MSYRKWLIATLSFTAVLAALVVAVNFFVDHHGIRLSLFSMDKEIRQTIYPDGINQHLFNPEFIFRNPDRFDSFLFGSSRTGVIRVDQIPGYRFYNMSYSLGIPSQHLAILKAFLDRGIKIKTVVIGLDDFCFGLPPVTRQKHLIRIMHPDIGGPGRLEIFGMYFFRKPGLEEFGRWKDRVISGKKDGRCIINDYGVNLGWEPKDRIIDEVAKPIFDYPVRQYEPAVYSQSGMDEAFQVIGEIIALARTRHFKLIFFITPFYDQLYLQHAEALFAAKKRLAGLTDYYDFSGFNSVTTNALNYYEESHYRYRVGDMMIKRMFPGAATETPDDFGILVTRENIGRHLSKQKRDLEAYLKDHHLQ